MTAGSGTASAHHSAITRPLGIGLGLHPAVLARSLQYLGMAITVMALTYCFLQLWQLPSIPSLASSSAPPSTTSVTASTKNTSGVTLYTNQDATAAYDLFGSKPVMLDALFLRGVVATGTNSNGSLNGFAIFEVDGKPTNAVGIGESLGKGLSLQSIGDESATLLYQGQTLEFKLSKPSSQKAITTQKK